MSFPFVFTKQSSYGHFLQSALIALSFTTALESRDIRLIVTGLVRQDFLYVSNLKTRGWLRPRERFLYLTNKAQYLISKAPIDLIKNKTGGDAKINHEIQLARTLFACLVHLNLENVVQIKKQKRNGTTPYFHDLTIVGNNYTLQIEVDAGSQPSSTLEAKIKGFQEINPQDTLVYFTSSKNTYAHYQDNSHQVQFIYLQSPTLSQDILQLSVNDSYHNHQSERYDSISHSPSDTYSEVFSDQSTFLSQASTLSYKLAQNTLFEEKSLIQRLFNTFQPETSLAPNLAERNYNLMRTGQGIKINSEANNQDRHQYDDDEDEDWDYLNNFEDN
jgi:hypothetical protein